MSMEKGTVVRQADGRIIRGHYRPPAPYWNADWLRRQYEIMGRTPQEIGDEFGISGHSIRVWLKRHGIRARSLSETRAIKHWGARRPAEGSSKPLRRRPPHFVPSIIVDGEIGLVELTRGAYAIIDRADVPLVEGRRWRLVGQAPQQYAAAVYVDDDGKRRSRLMHRVILAAPNDLLADHIDSDGLNNRRANLRLATDEQNAWNACLPSTNTSGYKGASWCSRRRRWRATIKSGGKQVWLGYFDSALQAHEAYRAAASRLRGEFARFA